MASARHEYCYSKVSTDDSYWHRLPRENSMMRLFTLCLLLFVPLQCMACASDGTAISLTRPDYHKVCNHFSRMSQAGFAIKPLAGKGWFKALADSDLVYRKEIGDNDYSVLSKATRLLFPSPDVSYVALERFIRHRQGEFLRNPRYRHQNLKADPAKGRSGSASYSLTYGDCGHEHVASRGLVCSYPEMPQNGIELSYREERLNDAKIIPFFQGRGGIF